MPAAPFQVAYTTFVKGFITEANPLNFPDNASIAEENFLLNKDGSRQRRLGMDFEEGSVGVSVDDGVMDGSLATSSHLWPAVGNKGEVKFCVVQVGLDLYFFNTKAPVISDAIMNGGDPVTLTGDESQPLMSAVLNGRFICVNGSQNVFILTYDEEEDEITVKTSRLEIRDLFGVDDEMDVEERLATCSDAHRYNLHNQGWPTKNISISSSDSGSVSDGNAVDVTKSRMSWYPSNADIVWAAKCSSAKVPAAIDTFRPEELTKIGFGSTQSPLGSYILDAFNRGESRQEIMPSLPDDQTLGGVTSVASFAGRAFFAITETALKYGDNRSPNMGAMLLFSQAKDGRRYVTRCYSEADPAAEHTYDVVDTDGGFINLPEAGAIVNLVTMGSSLFVFCTNGVWEIHGGEESFSATNHTVTRTTNVNVTAPRSIVYAEDTIAFWGDSGIFMLKRNDLTLRGGSSDISYATIQTFFDKIDRRNRDLVSGTYDAFSRTFRWLYRDAPLPNDAFYNKELVYDINLQAFYVNNIYSTDVTFPFISGFIPLEQTTFIESIDRVIHGTDKVKVYNDDVIVSSNIAGDNLRSAIKYLTFYEDEDGTHFTFSMYRNTSFRDWYSMDNVGIDAPAYMITGYASGGDTSLEKRIRNIEVFFNRTENEVKPDGTLLTPSSCMIQTQWDWTNNVGTGRWGKAFQAYRLPRFLAATGDGYQLNYGYPVIKTKSALRGKGRVLSLMFSTEPYHDLSLLGWSLKGAGNSD